MCRSETLERQSSRWRSECGVAQGAPTGSPTGATSGPPITTISGANPAHLNVGDSYADLGATITAPQSDLNLGIHTFVDGIASDPVVIDTAAAGTHSIDYVVTGISGLTSTTTRTVIVSAPANDNHATTTLPVANDNSPPPAHS